MAELSEDDRRVLDLLRRAAVDRNAIPPGQRSPVENPGRSAFAIGMDAQGKLFHPHRLPSETDDG